MLATSDNQQSPARMTHAQRSDRAGASGDGSTLCSPPRDADDPCRACADRLPSSKRRQSPLREGCGVLGPGEELERVVGVVSEVDVAVVRRPADAVLTDAVQQREVASLVHQVENRVELVDMEAA